MKIVALMFAALVVANSGKARPLHESQRRSKDKCAMLYTDDQARNLIKSAEAAVPPGSFLAKSRVLKALKLDGTRLCDRRVAGFNNAYQESWQMSAGFDLTWWAAAQDSTPLESDERKIYCVRIVARSRGGT